MKMKSLGMGVVVISLVGGGLWLQFSAVPVKEMKVSRADQDQAFDSEIEKSRAGAKLMGLALEKRVDQGLRVLREHLSDRVSHGSEVMNGQYDQLQVLSLLALVTSFRSYSSLDGPWMRTSLSRLDQSTPQRWSPIPKNEIWSLLGEIEVDSWDRHRDQLEPHTAKLKPPMWVKLSWMHLVALRDGDESSLSKILRALRNLAMDQQVNGAWLGEDGNLSLEKTAWALLTFNLSQKMLLDRYSKA
jgi:hypothetical protein